MKKIYILTFLVVMSLISYSQVTRTYKIISAFEKDISGVGVGDWITLDSSGSITQNGSLLTFQHSSIRKGDPVTLKLEWQIAPADNNAIFEYVHYDDLRCWKAKRVGNENEGTFTIVLGTMNNNPRIAIIFSDAVREFHLR
jgi:hypothetical protein